MRRRQLLPCLIAAVALLGSATAGAAPKGKARSGKAPRISKADAAAIEDATGLMASGDRAEVEAGIQSLGLLGSSAAVQPLVDRIRAGLPPDLLETAIITLMALGHPDAGPLLHELTSHRRANIRLRAVEALTAVKPPGAKSALLAALSDSDAKVRSAAASGLGEVGDAGALPTLFHALDRGNLEASVAIGKLTATSEVPRLLGYLGKIPFYSLGPALGEVLRRKDVREDTKLDVVARLQEVGTPEVKGFLGDLIATDSEAMPQRVTRAMLRAMQEIAD